MNVFRHSFFLIKERIFYMYLNEECLKSKELLSKINIKLPLFNRKRVQENTKKILNGFILDQEIFFVLL